MTASTPRPSVPSPTVQRACCDAYEAALTAELEARIVVPDDLTSHAEVVGLTAALPHALRDELAALLAEAFAAAADEDDVPGELYRVVHRRLAELVPATTAEEGS